MKGIFTNEDINEFKNTASNKLFILTSNRKLKLSQQKNILFIIELVNKVDITLLNKPCTVGDLLRTANHEVFFSLPVENTPYTIEEITKVILRLSELGIIHLDDSGTSMSDAVILFQSSPEGWNLSDVTQSTHDDHSNYTHLTEPPPSRTTSEDDQEAISDERINAFEVEVALEYRKDVQESQEEIDRYHEEVRRPQRYRYNPDCPMFVHQMKIEMMENMVEGYND